MAVEPIPNRPAAVADLEDSRALVVADYHAGIEADLRYQGVEVDSAASERRERLLSMLSRSGADELVMLGDLATAIGAPSGPEREEISALLDALAVPVTVVKGNHDGEIEDLLAGYDHATVTDGDGVRRGPVGFAHGHTWPSVDVLSAETVCVAHEHPVVRLEDEVGGTQKERVWLRGRVDPEPFEGHHSESLTLDADMVVFPAYNDLSGGTWVNVDGQDFLSPFMPAGLAEGEAYLLDGTRLGPYRRI